MRVLAGEWKGRRLAVPRGRRTRPTADQVRLALLDTLGPGLPGARFLDLFAGAGGVGFEALSRGAATATFVEQDRLAVAALRANAATLAAEARVHVIAADVARALPRLAGAGAAFDLVFLDPPYDTGLVAPTLELLAEGALLAPGALVVAQHFTKDVAPRAVGTLAAARARRFGETTLTFFRRDP